TERERQSRREQKQNHRERNAIEDVDDPERHVCLPIELPMARGVGSRANRPISAATSGRRQRGEFAGWERNPGRAPRISGWIARPLDRLPRAATFSAANLFGYYAAVAPPWRVDSRGSNPSPAGGRNLTAREGRQ